MQSCGSRLVLEQTVLRIFTLKCLPDSEVLSSARGHFVVRFFAKIRAGQNIIENGSLLVHSSRSPLGDCPEEPRSTPRPQGNLAAA